LTNVLTNASLAKHEINDSCKLEKYSNLHVINVLPTLKQKNISKIEQKCENLEIENLYEIYGNLLEREIQYENGKIEIKSQINDNESSLVVKFMIETKEKCGMNDDSLFLAIYIFDEFMRKNTDFPKKDAVLCGIVCLFIAKKFTHSKRLSLEFIENFINRPHKIYDKVDLLKLESKILSSLKFNINLVTPYDFLLVFSEMTKCDIECSQIGLYLIFIAIIDNKMREKYPSSCIAAASLGLAMKITGSNKRNLQQGETIKKCMEEIKNVYAKYGENSILNEKFSSIRNLLLKKYEYININGYTII